MSLRRLPKPTLRKGALTYEIVVPVGGKKVRRSLRTRDYNEAVKRSAAVYQAIQQEHLQPVVSAAADTLVQSPSATMLSIEDVCSRHRERMFKMERDTRRERAMGGIADPLALAHDYRVRLKRHLESARAKAMVHDFADGEWYLTWLSKSGIGDVQDRNAALMALALTTVSVLKEIIANDEGLGHQEQVETEKAPASTADATTNPLLLEIKTEWLAQKLRSGLRQKTIDGCAEAVGLFLEICGDRPVLTYNKTDMRAFRETVSALPANRRKIKATRNLNAKDAAATAKRLGLVPMNVKTVNERLSNLYNLFEWAAKNYDSVTSNPFQGATTTVKSNQRDEKHPFTPDDLNAIFNAPIYRGCQSKRDWRSPGEFSMRSTAEFWVPLLGLYTGARLNELCKLKVSDIAQDGDFWFIDINESGFTNPKISGRLKRPHNARRVPIHDDVIGFGFLAFIQGRQADGSERLFPELKPTPLDGKLQDGFGKHFARFLKSVGVKRPKIDFHSFRHTFVDACGNSRVPDDITLRLKGDARQGTLSRYGHGTTELEILGEYVAKIRFKGLNLDHLKV